MVISVKLCAQESIGGLVFDKDNKQRINRVSITNLRTKQILYNNNKGEFFIPVRKGDILIAAKQGYKNNLIDQVFSKEVVSRVTGLKGDKLLIFMINYRPSYNFVVQANEYVLLSYIKHAFIRYKMNPNMPDINSFKPIKIDP